MAYSTPKWVARGNERVKELAGRVALITGGGTGLGRELALQLAQEGMSVVLSWAHSQNEAEQTVAEIIAQGGQACALRAELSQTAEAKALVEKAVAAFGRLDLLVHNAATTRFIPFPDLEQVDEAMWDELFAVNTRAAFFLAQAAASHLRQTKGQLITTSSVAGLAPVGSSIPYAVSKAALIHLTRCLAVALAPDVRVNSVAPGLLLTRWVEGFSEENLVSMREKALLKKATDLSDVTAAFVMFAKNGSITGQTLTVDAGILGG